jgi:outer membrane protein OmpA-like peptidoglycan-associated protein
MMKKLIKVGVVMSLLLTSTSAFAQEKAEYPNYGFWSNWSIGFGPAVTWQLGQHAWDNDAPNTRDLWRRSINVGADLFAQKELNHVWDFRFRFSVPTFWRGRPDNDGDFMNRFVTMTAELMFSINNAIYGYNPDCHHSWYLFGGAGGAYVKTPSGSKYAGSDMGKVMLDINAGLGYNVDLCEKWSFYAEAEMNFNDWPTPWDNFMDWNYVHATFHTGLMYNFGLTEADKNIQAQKSTLTQENFNALNSQVNNLERQVANSRNNEKKLENRIAELEDQLAKALAQGSKGGNNAAADSLQAVIDKIKADQLTFYAMPFSVLYAVDDWKVSDEEEAKVKAVARVLKDNSDVKIIVVGFADYTGSDAYNMKLSEKRANEVKRLLVKRYGIAEDRISVDYKGKSVAFGDIQYALNRRVSFYRVIE